MNGWKMLANEGSCRIEARWYCNVLSIRLFFLFSLRASGAGGYVTTVLLWFSNPAQTHYRLPTVSVLTTIAPDNHAIAHGEGQTQGLHQRKCIKMTRRTVQLTRTLLTACHDPSRDFLEEGRTHRRGPLDERRKHCPLHEPWEVKNESTLLE